jgi:hypothetical protein
MDRESEKYYEAFKDMFSTEGWKILQDEMKSNALQINSVEAAKDNDDMFFRKGQLNIIAFILNLETTVEHMVNEGQETSNDSF